MDVKLGQFKKTTTTLTGGNRNVVPKGNAMNLIHGLQRNQTKLCYEELAHHCSLIPYVNYRKSFFGHVMS